MLAELADAASHDRLLARPDLVFEPKYDGIRALVQVEPAGPDGPLVRIFSRRGNDKTDEFPDLAAPLARLARRLDGPLLIDGEIVAVDARGAPLGFQHLQGRLLRQGAAARRSSQTVPVAFIAFDLLRDGPDDLRACPFTERRERLEARLRRSGSRALRVTASTTGNGGRLRRRAARLGWEGLVAKEPQSRYAAGRRHAAWRKLKFTRSEAFVVGGWTDPAGTRSGFGALLLGYHAGAVQGEQAPAGVAHRGPAATPPAALAFAGQVGSGFTQADLERIAAHLAALAADESPFAAALPAGGPHHWVRPVLVAEVRFTEWTFDGLLRNPVYLRLLDDKPAADVRLRRRPGPRGPAAGAAQRSPAPPPADSAPDRPDPALRAPDPAPPPPSPPRPAPPPPDPAPDPPAPALRPPDPATAAVLDALDDLEQRRARGTLVLPDGGRVAVGNLDKVFWPEPGITKGELLRFQVRIAPYLLPVVADRPLVMKRFPNGVHGKSFYQHRAPDTLPAGVRVASVREHPERAGSEVSYLVGGRLQTLVYMTQLAVVSQDPWFSRLAALDAADHVALDLDPPPGTPFARVLDVACWLHDELDRLGAPSFPKTSGASGLHIHIPLPPETPYEAGLLFCQIVATVVAGRHPAHATVERTVRRRARGAVYVDYLQNIYGKTLAAAYSARASAFAGVSTPLTWQEVREGARSGLDPADFTVRSVFARLRQVGDLWVALRDSQPARLEAALAYDPRGR